MAEAKKEYEAGVASGEINPYRDKMIKSAAQGYMLVLPSAGGLGVASLADMKETMKKLEEFPIEVCELEELNQLVLKNNKIAVVPPEIKNLQNLKILNLANNQLEHLPSEMGELKSLKSLNIKGNQIPQSEIDNLQAKLPKLKIKT